MTAAAILGPAIAIAGLWPGQPAGPPLSAHAALDDPPPVRGLSVDGARKILQDWDRSVVIQVVPEKLPAGVDESTVVVATATLLNPPSSPNVTVNRPVVRLALGARVPDLTGMTEPEAARALQLRGLALRRLSPQPEPTWVVTGQQFPPDSIVDFGFPITATFAAPDTGLPAAILVGAAVLALLLIALATPLGARTYRRRARRRRDRLAAAVRLETHPGQVVGPDLTEQTGTVSVRLIPHHHRGTLSIEEVQR